MTVEVFDGFERRRIATPEVEINAVVGGAGPPLLLLHGFPQSHVMWHKVAPGLARQYTVVAADLRGYGDSGKPPGAADHANYAFRAMAADQVAVMAALGFDRFRVAGHDRGARVTHRMALDHPAAVERAVILDILPTLFMYDRTSKDFATAYYHWFFLIQPRDYPESLINAAPEAYLRFDIGREVEIGAVTPEAWAEYLRCIRDPATVHAMCEDYRAAASIDLEHDRADLGRSIGCPLLMLWGTRNRVWRDHDMLAVWRDHAEQVTGTGLDSGHHLAEEVPDATLAHMLAFLAG